MLIHIGNEHNPTCEPFTNHSICRVCEQLIWSSFAGDKSEKRVISRRIKRSGSGRSGCLLNAAWHNSSAVTHPEQFLVFLLQLAFQVPHSLLNAAVTLLCLQMGYSKDRKEKVHIDAPV